LLAHRGQPDPVESKDQPGQVAHQVREVLKVSRDPVANPDRQEPQAQQGQVAHQGHKVFKDCPDQVESPDLRGLQVPVVTPARVVMPDQVG
jgi:hypothetical protein